MNLKKNITKYRSIHQIAYPVLLNYLLSSVFELLDKAIVGHYSVQGFAVVGAAASFTFAVTGALGILSAAFNIVAAEEKGRKNEKGFETAFLVSKLFALLTGICFFVLSLLCGRIFFQKVYGIQGDDLSELLSYFYPASFTVVQNMLTFQYSAYFRNCLNTKITLYSTIVSTGINLFFDFSLVYGFFGLPQLGTAGAAWGSVIGLAAGLIVYQLAYWKKHSAQYACYIVTFFHSKKRISETTLLAAKSVTGKILRLYPSLFGQELLESTIFACVISAVIARLGTKQMAVYSLLDTVGSMIGLPVYAYAAATQTYALQSHSAREMSAAKEYLKCGIQLTFSIIAMLCVLCGIFNKPLLHLIVDDLHIIREAQKLLLPVFLLQLVKIPYQIHMSCLQGIGREKFVLLCTAIGTICASGSVIIAGHIAGLTGLYIVMVMELVILGICYSISLRTVNKEL